MKVSLEKEIKKAEKWQSLVISGVVKKVVGLLIESVGPAVHLGEMCFIYNKEGKAIPCEVVGFKEENVLLMSLGEMSQIAPGTEVYPSKKVQMIPVGNGVLGRVLDAIGNPIDGKGPIKVQKYYPVMAQPPHPLQRNLIHKALPTGIKALDAACTPGLGQRLGIFSGPGLGKSRLLAMIANKAEADVNVIALIGERGREVREFIERDLGPEGLAKSVVIVVTSDQPALQRTKGAHAAAAIAEFFRDQGKNVVFMMDSITRYAMALREIGLAVGEPPTTKGYTPSVFAMLPKLLERAGYSQTGSITGFYAILTEGEEINDPIADMVRAILDGHIVLSKKLASSGHYPAIDILDSLSRVMINVVDPALYRRAGKLRSIMQTYKEAEDLINIGAYVAGSNPKIDEAISMIEAIYTFLKQDYNERFSFEETQNLLKQIIS